MVERFFRDPKKPAPPRVFRDVEKLIMAIADYVDKHNGNPKPFVGTAKAGPTSSKASNAPTKPSILADLIAALHYGRFARDTGGGRIPRRAFTEQRLWSRHDQA